MLQLLKRDALSFINISCHRKTFTDVSPCHRENPEQNVKEIILCYVLRGFAWLLPLSHLPQMV